MSTGLPPEEDLVPTQARFPEPRVERPTDDDPPGPEMDGMVDEPVWDDGEDIVIEDAP